MDHERGSAVVESVFGIFFLLFLALGSIQVALTLYARNVVQAAVHEGARAAIEVDAGVAQAPRVARSVIARSAGSLLEDLSVTATAYTRPARYSVTVRATGHLVSPGPVPIEFPVSVQATATREIDDGGH